MKRLLIILLLLLMSGTVLAQSTDLATDFTYQGYLQENGIALTDSCDMRFALYNEVTAGTQIGSTLDIFDVALSNGVFNVVLDFGVAAFDGQDHYLEIAIDTGCEGLGSYTTLSPRQPLTPAPYAIALYGLRTEANTTSPSIIGGNRNNSIASPLFGATISGGGTSLGPNVVYDDYGTVGGGANNIAGSDDSDSFVGFYATISGGTSNRASGSFSTIGGGDSNMATDEYAFVGGGVFNEASNPESTVAGGFSNEASGERSTVGGGDNNTASTQGATVAGGRLNNISASYSTIGGGNFNIIEAPNSFIGGGGGGFDPRFPPLFSTAGNIIYDYYGVIGGGSANWVGLDDGNITTQGWAVISGGQLNEAWDRYAAIGGGFNNQASGEYSVVSGGDSNVATGNYAAISGGDSNNAGGNYGTVSGGNLNSAFGEYSTIAGGANNTAIGLYSAALGGEDNFTSGNYSVVMGRDAENFGNNNFVWSDGSINVTFGGNNRFIAVSSGGATFYTGSLSTGVSLPGGGSGWIAVSDRNTKENFETVDPLSVLEQLVAMPVTEWNYITQDDDIRHMGVMAQDFDAAFGLGEDPLGINTIDMDGVTVAAIQGLYQQNQDQQERLEAQDTQLEAQQARIDTLEARLAALEADGPNGGVSFNWLVFLALGTGAWLLLRKR